MNTNKMLMKIANQPTPAILLAALLSLAAASNAGATVPIFFDWRFTAGVTTAAPEATSESGAPVAAVVPGEFAAGWMANNSILGAAQGVWDLGRNGTINLSNPSGFAGEASQSRVVTLKVVQYQDGAIYEQLAAASVQGATMVSSNAVAAARADLGSWVMQITQWNVPAGSPGNAISIVSSYYGSLIDEIIVEASTDTVQPPQLSIRRVGSNQVEISWPAAFGNMMLESTANVLDPSGWTAVEDAVQVNGGVRSVTLEAAGAMRAYRLKQL